jgi:hypothetical protein
VSTKRRRRVVVHRQRKPDMALNQRSMRLLELAERIYEETQELDTAMRDVVAEGLARIVYVAYDTQAMANNVHDLKHHDFIQVSAFEWFKSHEYVDWFAQGASCLFQTSLPNSIKREME